MTSKLFSAILGFLALSITAEAQMSAAGGTDWKDSSLIPASRMAQHSEFLNNQYSFPSKPRSQWEVGVKVGSPSISGDLATNYPNFGFGVHVRKSLGYLLSLRGEYVRGTATGLDWKGNFNYDQNTAWKSRGYLGNRRSYSGAGNTVLLLPAVDKVFYNYKTNINDLSVQALLNLSNVRFHKAEPKFGLYTIVGVGVTFYDTKVDALNASGQKYNFNSIPGGTFDTRKDTRSAINALLDGTYETDGDSNGPNDNKLFGKTARLSGTLGLGAAFKLSKRVNIAFEERLTFVKDDLLDGQRWSATPIGDAVATTHYDTYNFLSVGLNINIF
jgi:hypothetical protein